MPHIVNFLRTCLKCAPAFLLIVNLSISTVDARVLGTFSPASTSPSTNTTDNTASQTFTYNALAPDQLGLHLFARQGGDHKQPAPASDEALNTAAAKGCNLLYMMSADSAGALKRMQMNPKLKGLTSSQSQWTNAGDLKKYGWTDKKGPANWPYAGVDDVMKDLKIDKNDDKATSNIQLLQDMDVTVDGKTYKKSNGVYNQNMNTAAGLLMPYYIYSPTHEGKRTGVPAPYTPLGQYSDVSFLYWSKLCGRTSKPVCNIKNFLFINIENPDTWAIVLRVLQRRNGNNNFKLKEWPGEEFSMNSPEGKALLSTQIGTPLAWFLIQHKEQLGASKVTTKVTVFLNKSATNRDTSVPYPSLLFYVEDGPADTHCDPEDSCCCPNVK